MKNKKELRAEETRKKILSAAGDLFSEKGYNAVSIREIAKEAGCSHTAIYLYFHDKETLLYELSMPHLMQLRKRLELTLKKEDLTPEIKLKEIGMNFILFGLELGNMYDIFLKANASRVDEAAPVEEINELRISLFRLLREAIGEYLSIESSDQLLAYARIYFYTLHGIITTYTPLGEPLEELRNRLGQTFEEAIDILLLGFKEKRGTGK
ncbi:TetR/AcrR family transcriptional regulator [Falsibacillus pallidus]|uniref:TetR/AcrR family transcriptional regulator n=1 Tax=Falsibacillus pallidus TaxID=493781 RepID=UPI003D997197